MANNGGTMRGGFKWCPKGCGKTIYYEKFEQINNRRYSVFKCSKCSKTFNRKELEKHWKT